MATKQWKLEIVAVLTPYWPTGSADLAAGQQYVWYRRGRLSYGVQVLALWVGYYATHPLNSC